MMRAEPRELMQPAPSPVVLLTSALKLLSEPLFVQGPLLGHLLLLLKLANACCFFKMHPWHHLLEEALLRPQGWFLDLVGTPLVSCFWVHLAGTRLRACLLR